MAACGRHALQFGASRSGAHSQPCGVLHRQRHARRAPPQGAREATSESRIEARFRRARGRTAPKLESDPDLSHEHAGRPATERACDDSHSSSASSRGYAAGPGGAQAKDRRQLRRLRLTQRHILVCTPIGVI
jgi:hypothetical protein